jgi:hypothetical protein
VVKRRTAASSPKKKIEKESRNLYNKELLKVIEKK